MSRWEAEGTVMYAINRIVTLIGAGGYQDFDDGTAAAFGAASWDSGVELTPGPNTDIRATYGVDNDDPRLEARLEHRLSERTRFIVSATETLQTSQAQLGNTLTNIAVDPTTGQLIDPLTGLPFDPNASPFSVQDTTTRTTTYTATGIGSRDRNNYTVRVSYQEQVTEPAGTQQTVATSNLTFGRQLKPDLTLNLNGGFQYTDFESLSRQDYVTTGAATLTYTVFEDITASLNYSYRRRDSTDPAIEYVENAAVITLRTTF